MPAAKTLLDSSVTSKNQSGVQSLEIGLSILDVLIDRNEPMMLKDIAEAMQMHPAKSHRYLVSLIRKDYARKLDDGRYGVGDRVNALASLGHTGFNQNNLLARLTQVANEIKDTLNCGVQIAKWFSEGPIIIQSVEPDSPISIITRIGSRMPLTTSATGQLFASYQPDVIIQPLVAAEWQTDNEAIITEKWQNFSHLQAKIRTQGYATVTGDMLMGINAITIPVILPQLASSAAKPSTSSDKTVNEALPLEYAITIIGTTEQLPMSEQHNVVEQILAIAQRYQIA
ncbi:IclR family transcriptional regulator [Psychrobacter sp. K31L]|uniref:IclR family transcriptional regulator n=1 Tax=Psychrobacter sp. K31L TaxID=2820758 RepID=UPI001B336C12|nr:IclR family transcriptional regulator C-terminal domain-containing protein [Psychrobacter sp. K31L]MBP3945722.1 helix-turn-helix domain-containing protein [Psychrobacter sp. K31L]